MDFNNGGDDESATNDAAVVFVYDGVSQVPEDVTHVRVLHTELLFQLVRFRIVMICKRLKCQQKA